MIKDNPMMEKYVEISWCPADIKAIRPSWSDEKCAEELFRVSRWFEDRLIELGFETLEHFLDEEDEEEDYA